MLIQSEGMSKVLDILQASATGRVPRGVIDYVFSCSLEKELRESDIMSVISWAETRNLFRYDPAARELIRIGQRSFTKYESKN